MKYEKNKDSRIESLAALKWYAAMDIDDMTSITHDNDSNPYNSKDEPSIPSGKSLPSLAELKETVMNFTGCDLKKTATNTVFSDGIESSKIMVIGEAPGATEDEKGIPFCGDSGKLLDNMFSSIGLSRKTNLYITNIIFWRPPANRRPTKEEVEICLPLVEQHIAIIKPKLIILVGSTAVTSLLGEGFQISKIRQEYYSYKNKYLDSEIKATALFHPAYLMRQPMQKKTTWHDLLKIKEFISKNIIL